MLSVGHAVLRRQDLFYGEEKMKEMKEKIRERERRAEMVRQRKQLDLIEKHGQEEEENAIPRGKELDF